MDEHDLPPLPPLPPLAPLPLGDPAGAPADADALRGILRRHRRRQLTSGALALAVVLVAGGAAGFAVGNRGNSGASHGTQVAAGSTNGPSANTSSAGGSSASGAAPALAPFVSDGTGSSVVVGSPTGPLTFPTLSRLLVRDSTDGVRVRLYKQDTTAPKVSCPAGAACPQVMPACAPTSVIVAQVSDPDVAGQVGGPVWTAASSASDGPLGLISLGVVGAGEPAPILVVVAQVQSSVAEVSLTTPFGSDKQAPTNGYVALAVQLPADFNTSNQLSSSTLVATDSSGKTLVSQGLSQTPKLPPACVPCPALGAPTPAPNGAPNTKGGVAPVRPAYPCPLPCPPVASNTGGAVPNIAMCVRPGVGGGGPASAGSGGTTGPAGSGGTTSGSAAPRNASSGPATVTNP
jgi:hypothetical protein